MALKNPWVGYLDRSFEQMKNSILSKFPSKLPEITDLSENETTVKQVGIWAGLLEMLGYYVDNRAREAFLPTARRFASGVKVSKLVSYRIRGSVAASADITFRLSAAAPAPVLIPTGTQVATKEGIAFITTAPATIAMGAMEATAPARQWLLKTGIVLGYSDESADQGFYLEEDVVDNSITVTIGGNVYTPVETLIFSGPDDFHFVGSVDELNRMAITFGDGINGKIPPAGGAINSTYYTSAGIAGNIAALTLTEVGAIAGLPAGYTISAFNVNRGAGGSSSEGLEELRKRIPKFIRTQNRAVTYLDYLDIAEMAPGVARAGILFNCGKFVDVYVVPEGGGVASSLLLDAVVLYFEDKRMSTTKVQALSAGAASIQLSIRVNAYGNYANSAVRTAIVAALVDFFSVENQSITGSVSIGDIYEVVEAVEGVRNSVITLINVLPYARPINQSDQLNWVRTVTPLSLSNVTWRLKFMSATTFQITKGNLYQGLYAVGDAVDLGEVKIMVNGESTAGLEWEFISYPYNRGSIQLAEPSIPVAFEEDLDIIVIGGI